MTSETYTTSRRYFALATALATFTLISIGGLVTSHGAGMAVPDWPNTYGYNMFFFPFSEWVGGVFYEHTHRLVASAVGLMTAVIALWFYGRKARPVLKVGGVLLLAFGAAIWLWKPARWQDAVTLLAVGAAAFAAGFVWPRGEPAPRWLRRLGILAFVAVIVQGVLGGLRVTEMKDELGIFHAALAQGFFVLIAAMVLFQTKFWSKLPVRAQADQRGLRRLFVAGSILIAVQLIIGSMMRHEHAGLAIRDFPLAYGKWWPDMSPDAVATYNQTRLETVSYNSITAYQIALQMVHRIVALIITLVVAIALRQTVRQLGSRHPLGRLAWAWMLLIVAQVFLGAATIWTDKSADIATLHVAFGALALLNGVLLSLIGYRHLRPAEEPAFVKNPIGSPATSHS